MAGVQSFDLPSGVNVKLEVVGAGPLRKLTITDGTGAKEATMTVADVKALGDLCVVNLE